MKFLVPILLLCFFCGCKEKTRSEKIIHLWVFNNSPNPLDDMNKILKGFHVENPGLKVEVTILDWGSGLSKLNLAAATRNGPDVAQVPSTWAASLTDIDALMPLDSIIEIWGNPELFITGSRETMKPKNSTSITSLPWFLDVRPFYYSEDVLKVLHIDPNTISSREKFKEVLQKIKESNIPINDKIVSPMEYPAKNDWNIVHNFASWIFSAGGSFLNKDLSKSNLLDSKTLDGIYFYLDFVKNGYNDYSNLDKTTAGVNSDFDQGKTAFIGETTQRVLYLENQNLLQGSNSQAVNYGCIVPPTAKKDQPGKYFLGGSNLGIFKATKIKKESLTLLRYLTTQSDVQLKFSKMSGYLPALAETYNLPYFSENKNRKIFQKIVENGLSYPAVPFWSSIENDVLVKRFNNIFNIIASSEGKQWPQSKIEDELKKADNDINVIIGKDFQKRHNKKL
jgi:multiple sugar transport system substrate-binding protein